MATSLSLDGVVGNVFSEPVLLEIAGTAPCPETGSREHCAHAGLMFELRTFDARPEGFPASLTARQD
jgi:hypothetical protein